jgi:hypothetical protein
MAADVVLIVATPLITGVAVLALMGAVSWLMGW